MDGFMSRWKMPIECIARRPRAYLANATNTSRHGIGVSALCFMASRRELPGMPSRNAITRNASCPPPASIMKKSTNCTKHGLCSFCMIFASRWKRSAYAAFMRCFTATSCPFWRFLALNTSPNPPLPMNCRSWYDVLPFFRLRKRIVLSPSLNAVKSW